VADRTSAYPEKLKKSGALNVELGEKSVSIV